MAQTRLNRGWTVGMKGGIAILLGIAVLFFPGLAVVTLMTFLGLALVIGGLFFLLGFVFNRGVVSQPALWLSEGLLDLVVGALILSYPDISARIFILILGLWALLMGKLYLIRSYFAHRKFLPVINGLLVVAFALLLLLNPELGARWLGLIIGLFLIIYGFLILFNYFSFRRPLGIYRWPGDIER